MVQFWDELGFVVKAPRQALGEFPVYIEQERGKIHAVTTVQDPKGQQSPHERPPREVTAIPPTKNKPIKDLKSLQQHLQSAMAVELSTIPLYLFAMYTVKIPEEYQNDPRYQDPVINAVKG